MNVQICPKEKTTMILPCEIMVNGERIGEMEPNLYSSGSLKWHCILRSSKAQGFPRIVAQGFGESHQAAIAAAIRSGRAETKAQLAQIDEIAAKIGFQEGEAP